MYGAPLACTDGSTTICAVSACDASWDPSTDLLALISGSPDDSSTFELKNSAKFQGAAYAVQDLLISNTAELWGAAIFDEALIENSASVYSVPLTTLLPGMPLPSGGGAQTLVLENVPGSFQAS